MRTVAARASLDKDSWLVSFIAMNNDYYRRVTDLRPFGRNTALSYEHSEHLDDISCAGIVVNQELKSTLSNLEEARQSSVGRNMFR